MQLLAKQLINEDQEPVPVDDQVWHAIDNNVSGDAALICTGEFIDPGAGCGEYELKTVSRGGITCRECINRIKHFKSIRL